MVYEITVTEKLQVSYTIEADSKEDASKRFCEWADKRPEKICSDLMDYSEGWDYSEPEECPFTDVKHADIKKE